MNPNNNSKREEFSFEGIFDSCYNFPHFKQGILVTYEYLNSSIIISKYEGEFNSQGLYHNSIDSVPSTLEKVTYNMDSDESQIILSFKGHFQNGNYDIGTEVQVISEDLISSARPEFTEHIGLKVNHKEYPLDCANTYIVEKIGRIRFIY